jgi:hypothetical protein
MPVKTKININIQERAYSGCTPYPKANLDRISEYFDE